MENISINLIAIVVLLAANSCFMVDETCHL